MAYPADVPALSHFRSQFLCFRGPPISLHVAWFPVGLGGEFWEGAEPHHAPKFKHQVAVATVAELPGGLQGFSLVMSGERFGVTAHICFPFGVEVEVVFGLAMANDAH